jgi:hypothetical protein
MAGPAIVVVAGISTAVIAVKTDDGLVSDDYYRRGLGINRVIEREEHAQALALTASVQFSEAHDRVRVLITSGAAPAEPPILTMRHSTRAGLDQAIALHATAPGVYEGPVKMPASGTWGLKLEDANGTWRLSGRWSSTQASVDLAPGA